MSEQLGTCDLDIMSACKFAYEPHPYSEDCWRWTAVPAPAEPAEYTCPRCGSNVSTHICMGEPATENAGKVQATGTHWCLTCGITALGCGHELANRQDDSASAEPVAGETNVTCQHCQTAFYSANTQLAKCPKCKRTLALFHTPSVAGETKYAPLDTKGCFNTAAHFEHSWDYRNKTFRCLGKSIAPSVAGETKQCTIPPDGWTCSRKKGHEGSCAARPLTTTECDEGLSKEIGEELGFEVKRWDGDVLIRDSDSTEWTSAVAWARSAPQTVAVMLSDAFTSFVQCRARIVRGATPNPAPSVAVPEGEAKPFHDGHEWIGINSIPVVEQKLCPECGHSLAGNLEGRCAEPGCDCDASRDVIGKTKRQDASDIEAFHDWAKTHGIKRYGNGRYGFPAQRALAAWLAALKLERLATPPANPSTDKWRVGRKVGRTLYIGDRFIGSVDSRELASQIVEAVNAGGVSTAGMMAEAEVYEALENTTQTLRLLTAGCSNYPTDARDEVRLEIKLAEEVMAKYRAAHVLAEKGKR